jgi:hypothetical protein
MSESEDKKRHDLLSFHRFLLLCLPLTSAVVINCDFGTENYYPFGDVYQCDLDSDPQITSPAVTITSATGNHINASMTLASVKGFLSAEIIHTLNYFPRGLSDVFPNLEAIFIINGRLIEIHQSDLRPFATLRLLILYQNDIRTLEKDLFKYNTELEWIYVHDNKITSVYPTVFDRLEKLTGLFVSGNKCVTAGSVSANREEVLALIEDVKRQCLPKVEGLVLENFAKIDKVEQELMEFRQRNENQSSEMTRMIAESLMIQKQTKQVSFLTFITEKEPLFFFVALPSVLLLTVLNVLVIFACLKRGEKKKKEEKRVAGAAEVEVELREMREEGA